MKSVFSLLFLIYLSIANAQQVNEYKYIIVPDNFTSFEANQFQLNSGVKQILKKKNYEILSSDSSNWPEEVKQNPCMALTADLEKERNWRKNVLNLNFITCEGTQAHSYNASSNIKEYKEGFQEALKLAMQNISPSSPKEAASFENKSIAVVTKEEKTTISTNPKGNTTENAVLEMGTEFKNGSTIYVLTELKDGSFALIQKDNSTIIALLKPTSRKEVFQVSVLNAAEKYTTVGYFDGKTLGIDYLNSAKEFELTEFHKLN